MKEVWHEIGCASVVGGKCNCRPKDVHAECRAQAAAHTEQLSAADESWARLTNENATLRALVARLVEALKSLTPIARSLWQMVDDSDIGHRALRPATKEVIDQSAALLAEIAPTPSAGTRDE